MVIPGRSFVADDYRYGFNGKEKDPEGMGGGESTYDYGFRIYNPSICKFLSVDPLAASYPWYTPYQFAGNMPILMVDMDGLEPLILPVGLSTKPVLLNISIPGLGGVAVAEAEAPLEMEMGTSGSSESMNRTYETGQKVSTLGHDGKYRTEAEKLTYLRAYIKFPGGMVHGPDNDADGRPELLFGDVQEYFDWQATLPNAHDYSNPASLPDYVLEEAMTKIANQQGTSDDFNLQEEFNKRNFGVHYSIDEKRLDHIFRNKEGHFKVDTPENRFILQTVASNQNNFLGQDKFGNDWFAEMKGDVQIWVQVRDGKITAGGQNEAAASFDSDYGLCNPNP